MTTKIKLARIEDAQAITKMLVQLATEIGDSHKFMSNTDAIRRYGFGKNRIFQCFIAESHEEHQGIAVFFPEFSTTRGKPGVYIQDLWVSENARGQGLGGRLLAEVAKHAASEWQAAYLKLTVYEDNSAAAEFYRRLGFQAGEGDRPMSVNETAFQQLKDQV